MEGLSTYRFEHPLGATFVVDNARHNRDLDLHHREALSDAIELHKSTWELNRGQPRPELNTPNVAPSLRGELSLHFTGCLAGERVRDGGSRTSRAAPALP